MQNTRITLAKVFVLSEKWNEALLWKVLNDRRKNEQDLCQIDRPGKSQGVKNNRLQAMYDLAGTFQQDLLMFIAKALHLDVN